MSVGIDELAHVCSVSGEAFLTFEQAQDVWPLPVELRGEYEVLLAQLADLGTQPVAGRGSLTPRQLGGAATLL